LEWLVTDLISDPDLPESDKTEKVPEQILFR